RIFRKKDRRCHSECHNPRVKDHSLYEMVRSYANERPHRKWICSPLPGHLAGRIYSRRVTFSSNDVTISGMLEQEGSRLPYLAAVRIGLCGSEHGGTRGERHDIRNAA